MGYLDRLYVHKDHQGIGIATALYEKLEASVESATVTTHAFITARPFFEDRGYVVKKEQQVERQGILLTNYVMEKQISPLTTIRN
jgi:acetyltransferase, GNAT family